MKINSIIDLVKDLDTSRQTKNLNKLLIRILLHLQVEFSIVLAGFLPIIPKWICEKWERKIINIHPSLLPKYGGKGMYGVKVQEAILRNHEKYAGCTVHYVDSEIDTGEIIAQKKILVMENESAWELGGRVFNEEIILLPLAIKHIREAMKVIP